jgi:hypothetical protein
MAELEAYEEGIDLNIIPWDAGADSQPDLSGSQSSLPETRGSVSPSTHPSTHTAPLHSSTNTSPSSQTSIGRSGTRTTAAATATIEMEHCPDLHLFFVVDCGRNPKLEQKPTAATTPTSTTHRLSNDESLYRWIRQMYIRHRGWFHFYFGIRQFIGCDFYQVTFISQVTTFKAMSLMYLVQPLRAETSLTALRNRTWFPQRYCQRLRIQSSQAVSPNRSA